jgi:hypothetical protein
MRRHADSSADDTRCGVRGESTRLKMSSVRSTYFTPSASRAPCIARVVPSRRVS